MPEPGLAGDRQAIIDLTIAYTWALDTKHLEELREVFTPDATADLRGVVCDGIDAIIERIGGAIGSLERTQHLVGNHQVRVDGDTATCRCQLQSQHVVASAEGVHNFLIGGIYEDRVVRTPAGWRIARRVLTQSWSEGDRTSARR